MKKILLIFVLTLTIAGAVLIRTARVDALTGETRIVYADQWQLDDELTPTGFEITIEFDAGTLSTLDVIIPGWLGGVIEDDGNTSRFVVMGTGGSIIFADLADWVQLSNTETIHFDFDTGSIVTDGVNYANHAEVKDTNYVFIYIVTPDMTEWEAALEWMQQPKMAYGITTTLFVVFFDRNVVIDAENFELITELPTEPTPPTGYEFAGWRTATGVMVDWTNFIALSDGYIVTDDQFGTYLPLYAFYRFIQTGTEETPDADPGTVPAFLSGPFGMIGLDNEPGYFLLFSVVAFLILFFVVIKVGGPIKSFAMLALLVWTVAGTWLGILPLWGTAILLIFEIGFVLKGMATGGEEA